MKTLGVGVFPQRVSGPAGTQRLFNPLPLPRLHRLPPGGSGLDLNSSEIFTHAHTHTLTDAVGMTKGK